MLASVSPHSLYRVAHLLTDLGWVDLDLGCSTGRWAVLQLWCCPSKTVEHPKSKSTQARSARRWVTLYKYMLSPCQVCHLLGLEIELLVSSTHAQDLDLIRGLHAILLEKYEEF